MKNNVLCLFLIIIFFTSSAQAQQPTLAWAKGMGGTYDDHANAMVVDAAGNVYTTGQFTGTVDFDPGPAVYNLTTFGAAGNTNANVFVSKLDADGNFIWVKQMGGRSDNAYAIALDAAGNIYTTGTFILTADFDPGPGVFNLTQTGFSSADMFVSKLDAMGNFVWAKRIGGDGYVIPSSIAIDAGGNVVTTGSVNSAYQSNGTILSLDFDPGPGVFNITSTTGGYDDVFVSKLDASGNFVWAKRFGGSNSDKGFGIAIDATGNIFTTGSFIGKADFDPAAGTANLTSAGLTDIFISKLDASGNFIWAKRMGGIKDDYASAIALDAYGNIHTTGQFTGTVDFDPGAGIANLTAAGSFNYPDIFVSKLDAAGNYIWAKNMGGGSADRGVSITLDALGNVYTTGEFNGNADFDPGAGVANITAASTNTGGGTDFFISKLNSSGNYVWARGFGGTANDGGSSIHVDANSNVYATGYYSLTADFDPCPSIFNLTAVGATDIYVLKLSLSNATVASFGPLPVICQGSVAPILPTTSTNGITGTWSPATVSNIAGATYTFTPAPGQCATTAVDITTIVLPNTATTFLAIPPICSGEVAPVLPTTSTNNIVGTWIPSTVSNTTSAFYTFTPNAGQCASSATLSITVKPIILPIFTAIPPICNGASAPILPSTSINGIVGIWNPSTVSNTTTSIYTFTPNAGQCASVTSITISVNPTNTPIFTPVAAICSGAVAPILPTVSTNGITGNWSPATVSNTVTGNYNFTPNGGQCASTAAMTINVNAANSTSTFAAISTICYGTIAPTLPNTSTNGIEGTWVPATISNTTSATYIFTPNAGQCTNVKAVLNTTVTPSVTPTFNAIAPFCSGSVSPILPLTSTNSINGTWNPSTINNTTSATYTFTPNADICATTASLSVIVNQKTIPTFAALQPICVGSTASILPSTSSNGITGNWLPAVINNNTSASYIFTPDAEQCATTAVVNSIVNEKITPTFVTIPPICKGSITPVLPIISIEGMSGSWNPSSINTMASASYYFTPTAGQCAKPKSITVVVNDNVTPTFTIIAPICIGSVPPNLPSVSTNGITGVWNPPTINNSATTNYTFTPNIGQCAGTALLTVIATKNATNGGCKTILPNSFTPNGDGKNDIFKVLGNLQVEAFEFNIYNRYGQKIFNTTNINYGWDGMVNGVLQKTGVFIYTIKYLESDTKTVVAFNGTVMLID